jgi:hypothetical protein
MTIHCTFIKSKKPKKNYENYFNKKDEEKSRKKN